MDESNVSQKRHILCMGICCLHIVQVCDKAPVDNKKNRSVSGYWQRGGNASNFCTILRQLDMRCEFFGIMTILPGFAFLLDDCRKRGISTKHCPKIEKDPPVSSVVTVLSKFSQTIMHSNDNFPCYTYEDFLNIPELSNYGWIHLEARAPQETLKILRYLYQWNQNHADKNITISLHLERRDKENLTLTPWVDLIFITKYFATYMGWMNMRETVFGFHKQLNRPMELQNSEFKPPTVICQWDLNSAGYLLPPNKYYELNSTPNANIVDTLGAGDTFAAGVLYALYEKEMQLNEAIEFGNRLADVKVGYTGFDEIGQYKKRGFK